jgi:hypothetical protein
VIGVEPMAKWETYYPQTRELACQRRNAKQQSFINAKVAEAKAAVQAKVQKLLPSIVEQVRSELIASGKHAPSGALSAPPMIDLETWPGLITAAKSNNPSTSFMGHG